MEHVGYDMNRVHGTIHTEDFNHTKGTQIGTSIVTNDVDTEFHEYALEWHPNRIDIFLDDVLLLYGEGQWHRLWGLAI